MHGIEVNVQSGSVRVIQFTEKQEAEAKAKAAAWEEARKKEQQAVSIETLITSKIREIAVSALKTEGKLSAKGGTT